MTSITKRSICETAKKLCAVVQRNGDIADANCADEYTLCTYLLKMREYYRWSEGFGTDITLSHSELGSWIDARERLWEDLEDESYEPIVIDGTHFDIFDNDGINQLVNRDDLVYSAGLGRFSRPLFFLGQLLKIEELEGYRILISGDEHARGLTAPPAMSHQTLIFVRRDALRRLLWEHIEDWNWRKRENALARAIRFYDFDSDANAALERMTDNEMEAVILHEIGEIVAGQLIGHEWHAMLSAVSRSVAEIIARAVRDHLADCLSSLPALLDNGNIPSLHFYFANLDPMRKDLFPALDSAYHHWVDSGELNELKRVVRHGKDHWSSVADRILEFHHQYGDSCQKPIESLVSCSRL